MLMHDCYFDLHDSDKLYSMFCLFLLCIYKEEEKHEKVILQDYIWFPNVWFEESRKGKRQKIILKNN